MEFGTAIIGAIFIAICIVPFIVMSLNRKKKENQILKSLTNLAKQHNCQITQHDICRDFIIGIDEQKNFAFFYKNMDDSVVEQFVDLAEIQSCKAVDKTRPVNSKAANDNVIENLELSFMPIDKTKKVMSFGFYDSEVYIQLNGELQLVEKWAQLINKQLKAKK